MAEQVGEHLGAYSQIDLARRVRVAQHMAAKIEARSARPPWHA